MSGGTPAAIGIITATNGQGRRFRGRRAEPKRPVAAAAAGGRRRPPWCSAAAASPGGVYEIGALRAIDLLATNRTVNEFDVYVGTSAGAFVSSLVANGVTPEEMMRVLNRDLPSPIRDIDLAHAAAPNYGGFLRRAR